MGQRLFLATVSVAALAISSVAHAQQTPVQAVAVPSATQAPAVANTATQDVVITAERRSVNLQKSAIAATVLTGSDLLKKGVVTVDQLQFVTPNLTVQNFGQGNLFNIRGIGKADGSSSVSVGVITYRDGVATFPGYFQDEPYYDIANVQVLRGPQGTFAGQNATGGAVFVTEADPNFGGFHGYLQGQYGNYNDAGLQGAVNIPISDTLALRVAANSEYRDSFYTITGPHTGDPGRLQSNSVRASLLWAPTDSLKVLLKADYNDINSGGYAADPPTATNDLFHITNNAHNEARDVFDRLVLTVSYVLPDGITLKSISGYQKGTTTLATDYDGTSAANLTLTDRGNEQIYSQEFNIISPNTGPLTWVPRWILPARRDNVPDRKVRHWRAAGRYRRVHLRRQSEDHGGRFRTAQLQHHPGASDPSGRALHLVNFKQSRRQQPGYAVLFFVPAAERL